MDKKQPEAQQATCTNSDSWNCKYCNKTKTCAALAAGQATAAQTVVQDDLITIRKPATSAELLWLLKIAHLVISDVDKTLGETFAPAQPAPATQQAGIPGNFITHRAAWREALATAKFFSTGVDRSYWDHELAAFDRSFDRLWTLMRDAPHPSPTARADSVQEDAAREAIEKVLALFPFNVPIQKFSVNNGPCLTADNDDEFYSVKRVIAFLTEIKTTLDAGRKQGANHDR